MSARSKQQPGRSLAGCMLHHLPHHWWGAGRMPVGSPPRENCRFRGVVAHTWRLSSLLVAALLRSLYRRAQPQEAGRGQGTWTKGSGAESSRAETPAAHTAGSGTWPGDNVPHHLSCPQVAKSK